MSGRPVRVHVEQLVLHGFDPRQRHRIGDAVRAELAETLSAGGLGPPADGPATTPRIDAGTVTLGARGDGIGAGVAKAVRGVLRR